MTVDMKTGKPFPRGAKKSPRHKLLAAPAHQVTGLTPPQFALVPKQLDPWGNNQYGCCVTSEEAFAKACYNPEIFIPTQTVTSWASRHGVLNGASLTEVLDSFQKDGFQVGGQQYNDGAYVGVDYTKQGVLQSAISQGPVKIAIDANALPSGAGNKMGWFVDKGGNYPNTDHCVSTSGYGRADYLYDLLKVPLPSALSPSTPGYLVYTWSTIGFVVHEWFTGTCVEAWLRNPTTVGVPPLSPEPGPGPGPVNPGFLQKLLDTMLTDIAATVGSYPIVGKFMAAEVMKLKELVDSWFGSNQHLVASMCASNVGGPVRTIIDMVFASIESSYPTIGWVLKFIQPLVDSWLVNHGY